VKGKNNFICAVKNDFIINGTYRCGSCVSNSVNECHHKTADYGPCMSNEDFSSEIVKFRGISISKRKWKKYIPNLKIVDYGYDSGLIFI